MTFTTTAIDDLLRHAVTAQVFPGAVWATGTPDTVLATGATGLLDPAEPDRPTRTDTVFDVASLTKILAVWSAVGALADDGSLPLDEPLGAFWPEAAGRPLALVTARHLLTHTAGLPPRANLRALYGTDPHDIREGVLGEALHRPPSEAVEYTDRAALILGYLAEHLSGQRLDALATERVWHPLGMTRTRFGPLPAETAARCAPTELDPDTGKHVRGSAHDYSARLLGGVCGIAGVFSVVDDLTAFLRYVLTPDSTTASGAPGFGADWVKQSLRVQTAALTPPRGLFWHPAPGTDPADDVWVHYGFTGTGMWVSPSRDRWAVLLTNKLYYGREREALTAVRNTFRATLFA